MKGGWGAICRQPVRSTQQIALHLDTEHVCCAAAGSFIYRRIPDDSLIGCMAAMYGFTPFTISVGTSYFERLAAKDSTLLQTARSTPEFAAFVAATPMEGGSVKTPIGAAHRHLGAKHW